MAESRLGGGKKRGFESSSLCVRPSSSKRRFLTVNAPRCPSFHATVPTVLVGWPGTAFHQLRTFGRAFLARMRARIHARAIKDRLALRTRSRAWSRMRCNKHTRGDREADTGAPWRGYIHGCVCVCVRAFVSAGSRARQWLMVSWMEAFRLLVLLAYTVNGPPETAGYTLFPLHQTAPRWRGKNERDDGCLVREFCANPSIPAEPFGKLTYEM